MRPRKKFEWQVPKDNEQTDDALLNALVTLTKYYKSPCSPRTLVANLPLQDNKLTPTLFSRAAERAQLEAKTHSIPLDEIKAATLPVVLLMSDGTVAIMVDTNEGYARVLLAETGSGLNSIPLDKLKEQYSGVAIFVKPKYRFTQRSKETLKKDKRNWFWQVVQKAWPIYAEVLCSSALINCFALAIPLFVMNVYDRVVPNHAIETLWVLASGVTVVFIFDFILKTMRGYFIDAAGKKIDVELSAKIFEQIMDVQMPARPRSVGALANTVQSFEVFRDFMTSSTVTIFVDLPFVFLFIFVIYLLGGNIALLPLLMLPLVVIVGVLIQLPLVKLTKQSYQYSAEKQATLIESLTGVETIKTCGAEGNQQTRWEQVVSLASTLGTKLRFFNSVGINFAVICQQLVSISVVILGVYKISEGELTVGALIACTILSGRAIAPITQLAGLISRYFQSMNALRSIHQVMLMPTDFNPESNYLHRPNLEGSVEFKNVSFKYGEDQLDALKNVNFTITPGERVAIIGSIGSGKSSIAKLIMGLYTPVEGSILLGGVEHNQLNPSDLRYQIGYVPQDVMLFYGTVRSNIMFGAAHMDDTAMLKAASLAKVDRFTTKHPKGFDLEVSEQGRNLSHGQRQSVAIARSVLLSPNFLLYDEPCSSMDSTTEQQICANLNRYVVKNSKTLLLITHKPPMLQLVDRIIVVDGGRIVLDGPKVDVLKRITAGKGGGLDANKAKPKAESGKEVHGKAHGKEVQGKDAQGKDAQGKEAHSKEAHSKEAHSKGEQGKGEQGKGEQGKEAHGKEAHGKEAHGKEAETKKQHKKSNAKKTKAKKEDDNDK